jgi:hypothetical protein
MIRELEQQEHLKTLEAHSSGSYNRSDATEVDTMESGLLMPGNESNSAPLIGQKVSGIAQCVISVAASTIISVDGIAQHLRETKVIA